jgi:pantothenate kinase
VESLAMFLWMVGAPQSIRQAENRFVRSMETLHRKFDKVLEYLGHLIQEYEIQCLLCSLTIALEPLMEHI